MNNNFTIKDMNKVIEEYENSLMLANRQITYQTAFIKELYAENQELKANAPSPIEANQE